MARQGGEEEGEGEKGPGRRTDAGIACLSCCSPTELVSRVLLAIGAGVQLDGDRVMIDPSFTKRTWTKKRTHGLLWLLFMKSLILETL
jgi:hypothetical protein